MAVVAGEEEEWRQWQRATMGVVVLDHIDDNYCDGAMEGDYEDNNGDGAMYDYGDDNDRLTTTTMTTTVTITLSCRRLRIGDGDDTGSASSLAAGGRVIN